VIEQRVRSIIGTDGVLDIGAHGSVEVAPRSEEECALLLAAAHDAGWSVRLCGGGGWIQPDAPADLAVSTRRLVGIFDLSPADLVMTARVGTQLGDLQATAANQGTWIALDPPGASRSLGSILATGTAGPLRTGYGAVRSRILGLTLITGDGRIVRVGGRVVKNVAGFDLKSLLVGSFGAFGLITSAHIRLNALPLADVTLVANAARDTLLEGARAILSSGVTPAAMELISHDTGGPDGWALAVRVVGSEAAVRADRTNITGAVSQFEFDVLDGDLAAQFWSSTLAEAAGPSTTVRLGSLPSELGQALDLLSAELHDESGAKASVSVLAGVTRWSCNATSAQLQNLRRRAANHEWPVTLERAPWEVCRVVGHYGAYRVGVGGLVASLRTVFDERGLFVVPLGATK
jgi:glycolate oxidase FAD binding subunit